MRRVTAFFVCWIFILVSAEGFIPTIVSPQEKGSVSIPFDQFQQVLEVQEADQWCWAACISMLFHFYGHPVSQKRIVSSVYGMPVNMPAGAGIVIARQLNRTWTDDNGETFTSRLIAAYDFVKRIYNLNNPVLVRELGSGHPIIIGVGSHAVVLTGVDYDRFPNGYINVTRAFVFDPWPGRGIRTLTPQEMYPNYPNGYSFAATVRIQD